MSGTRVFKSKEARGRRVVEALVMGTLGDVKPLHSSTPTKHHPQSAQPWENIWYWYSVLLFTEYQHYGKEHTAHL